MRWIAMVLALMFAGVALAEDAEPFPFTKDQMSAMKVNSPEEAKWAKWVFNNLDKAGKMSEAMKASGAFGVHKDAGVLVMATQWKDHNDKMMKPEAGNKFVAVQLGIMAVDKEHSPNPLYAKIQCSGAVYETSMMATAPSPKLGTTSVMAGESTKGNVVFEVPATATPADCKWAYDVPMKGRTPWLTIVAK